MTDRALDDLIAAVEAGTFLANDALSPRANESIAYRAFSGSLDAAKVLHEAMLPGWQRQISESNAKVWERQNIAFFGEAIDNDARAWLLAILRAKCSQDDSLSDSKVIE